MNPVNPNETEFFGLISDRPDSMFELIGLTGFIPVWNSENSELVRNEFQSETRDKPSYFKFHNR